MKAVTPAFGWEAFARRGAPHLALLLGLALMASAPAAAQDRGTLDPRPLPPLAEPTAPTTSAKQAFGRALEPADLQARSIGFYAKGCLAGAEALPINGEAWQVMRLSRNRNWGNPKLIAFLERFSKEVPSINGWPGLLVGDISQPRGGPMLTGHSSHQIGLDADVWLSPMPHRDLSRQEREFMSATNVVRPDGLDVDPDKWTPQHLALIKAAAEQPEVERIFVNPAIKKAICREAGGDRGWLAKVRPMWGHNYHFPRPDLVPGRRRELHPAGACGRDGGLRRFAGLVVQARGSAPAPEPRCEAEGSHHPGPDAASLPAGAGGAVDRDR